MAIKDLTQVAKHLFICNGGSCKIKGAEEMTEQLRCALSENGYGESVHTTKTLCNGRCNDGPIIISQPDGIWFKEITVQNCGDFINSYITNGVVPPEKRLYGYGEDSINNADSSKARQH